MKRSSAASKSGKIPTPAERRELIAELVEHLEADDDIIPAEVLRAVRLLPGWGLSYRHGGVWEVEAAETFRAQRVTTSGLITILRRDWIGPAKVVLG